MYCFSKKYNLLSPTPTPLYDSGRGGDGLLRPLQKAYNEGYRFYKNYSFIKVKKFQGLISRGGGVIKNLSGRGGVEAKDSLHGLGGWGFKGWLDPTFQKKISNVKAIF